MPAVITAQELARSERLGTLLEKKQKQLQLNQDQFCNWISRYLRDKNTCISYGALQGWMNKKRAVLPSIENFYALSRVFGVSMDELYDYLEDFEGDSPLIKEEINLSRTMVQLLEASRDTQMAFFRVLQAHLMGNN